MNLYATGGTPMVTLLHICRRPLNVKERNATIPGPNIVLFSPSFSTSFLLVSCGSLTVTLPLCPFKWNRQAHRFPMIPAPQIKILVLCGTEPRRSQPCAMQDRGSHKAPEEIFILNCVPDLL